MKEPYVINLKKPEDSAEQIASKLNTLTGAINVEVIAGAVHRDEFDKYKKANDGIVGGYEDRIGYNIKNGRKVLNDDRYHGAGLAKVTTDATLTGEGTPISPLHAIAGTQTITLTGDVTGTGTGTFATTLASGINATKIANGLVSSTEFQYLDGVTSAIQTQINTKSGGCILSSSRIGAPTFTANGTHYSDFSAALNASATETDVGNIITRAGTLRNLYIDPSSNTLNTGTGIFTIMVNGVASSIVVTISAGATTITSDTTHTASVTAGDRISIRGVLTGATGSITPGFSIQVD